MADLSHAPDPDRPVDITPSRQSQYPDPESSGIAGSAWFPPSLSHESESLTGPYFQSHPYESFSLETSRSQFESISARRRSQTRELSDESDFLEEISDE
jgi:general transcription factor 3C polypeptide 3 (transcription factor C subunit 4)